jgi:signal peptidase II
VVIAVTAALVFLLDAATKWLVQARLRPGQSVPVLPPWLYITYVRNPGMAFGLLPHATWLFVLVAVLVMAAIVVWGQRLARGAPRVGVALGLLLGGAAGNLLDRLLYGRVVDFLDLRLWSYVFNVADGAIVVGAVVLGVSFLAGPGGGQRAR